jgi:hypothetical protein
MRGTLSIMVTSAAVAVERDPAFKKFDEDSRTA